MSEKPTKIIPFIPHYKRGNNEVVLETESDFYDRLGNKARVTKVVYRDNKGKFHEETIRVKWEQLIDIKKTVPEKVHLVRAYISLMVCSNGLFFYTTLAMSNGVVSTPKCSKELYKALYDVFYFANMFGIEPDIYEPSEHVSAAEIAAAYEEISLLVESKKNRKSDM